MTPTGEPTSVEVVARCLVEAGATTVFGVVGSGNFAVTDALVSRGARFVAARHEGGAACMADAHARVTGDLGVASVHQGPGLTNAITGIAEAAKSRTPMIVLAGETPGPDVRSNFRIDQAGLSAAVGASVDRVHGPESAQRDAMRAIRRARAERRTVVLMLPLDVQAAPAPWLDQLATPTETPSSGPAPDAVAEIVDLLERADRPVVLAGRGAVVADAGPALTRLADLSGALLSTSAMGNGLFAGQPWNIGISGGFSSPLTAELLAEADLTLVFGARLTHWTTRSGELVRSARIVQVDVEGESIGASHPVSVGVRADARVTAEALCAEIERRGGPIDPGLRTPELRQAIAAGSWRAQRFADASTADRIDPRTLTIALDDLLPGERTVVVDSGHFMGWPPMFLSVPDPAGFVFTQSFQSIGLGLADAVGAAVARPDRLTVGLLGDGGLLMGVAELETVARLGLPVLLVVYNDAGYGAEVHHFGPLGHSLDTVRFPDTDIAALAAGAGLRTLTARTVDDLDPLRAWLADPDGPLLVDAKIATDVRAHWHHEAMRAH